MATDRVPDAYMHNAKLSDEIISLRKQLAKANSIAAKASSTWDTFRKERDFHRMHHKRVVQVRSLPTCTSQGDYYTLQEQNLRHVCLRLYCQDRKAVWMSTQEWFGRKRTS